jgi:hypothetical protein
MLAMATWEDGPEYAPLERPAEFASPAAKPLDEAPPVVAAVESAPLQRPQFRDPSAPVAPLSTLVPVVQDPRDPQLPFDVVTTNLTSGSAWGSAHGGLPPAGPVSPAAMRPAPAALPAAYAPESLLPLAADPADPWPVAAPVPGYPPPVRGTFPSPGTAEWFGPGPYGERPPPPRVDARQVLEAATPGLLIVLGVGALIFVLSPVLLAVAFSLRSRVRVAQQQVRRALGIALGLMIFFAFVGLSGQPLGFSEWWSFVGFWSLLRCWASLVTVGVLVYRGLRGGSAAPPSYPNPWR